MSLELKHFDMKNINFSNYSHIAKRGPSISVSFVEILEILDL